jgi:hypothetical protein
MRHRRENGDTLKLVIYTAPAATEVARCSYILQPTPLPWCGAAARQRGSTHPSWQHPPLRVTLTQRNHATPAGPSARP